MKPIDLERERKAAHKAERWMAFGIAAIGLMGMAVGVWAIVTGRGSAEKGLLMMFASSTILTVGAAMFMSREFQNLQAKLADAKRRLVWLDHCGMSDAGSPDRRCVLEIGHTGDHRLDRIEALETS